MGYISNATYIGSREQIQYVLPLPPPPPLLLPLKMPILCHEICVQFSMFRRLVEFRALQIYMKKIPAWELVLTSEASVSLIPINKVV